MALEIVHEDDRVRVRRLTLGEAEQTSPHTHDADELSITISGSSIQERNAEGFLIAEHLLGPGDVRLIPKGAGPHVLVNSGVGTYVAILVEAKIAGAAASTLRKRAKA